MLVLLWRKVQLKLSARCAAVALDVWLAVWAFKSRGRGQQRHSTSPCRAREPTPFRGSRGCALPSTTRLRSRVWTPKPASTVGSFVGSLCKNCASTGYKILGLELGTHRARSRKKSLAFGGQ